MKLRYSALLTLIVFIQGCGSDSTTSNNAIDETATFEVAATLINDCGQRQSFDRFTVYLQDDDWNTLSSFQADENGRVSIDTVDETITFTLVAEMQQGDGLSGLEITSFADVPSSSNLSYEATFDTLKQSETCECVSQDINLRHRSFAEKSNFDASATFIDWVDESNQLSVFQGTTLCRENGEEWPVHSFTVFGRNLQGQLIGSSEITNDFGDALLSSLDISAIQATAPYAPPMAQTDLVVSQLFQQREHFKVRLPSDATTAPIFDSHPFIDEARHKSISHQDIATIDSLFGNSSYQVNRQIISTDVYLTLDNTLPITHPSLDYETYSELGEDGNYDYSLADSDMLNITFVYDIKDASNNAIPVTWELFGPVTGTLPMTVGIAEIDNIVNPQSDVKTTQITLYNSEHTDNYNNYIFHFMGNVDEELISDLTWYQLSLSF
ncbi:MAG: hypothetical protein AAGJ37_06565 [Pseudomonadota bacterium]